MTTIVTGAAGFIGSHLCERLAKAGHSVLGLDAVTSYYSSALKEQNVRSLRKAGVRFERVDRLRMI